MRTKRTAVRVGARASSDAAFVCLRRHVGSPFATAARALMRRTVLLSALAAIVALGLLLSGAPTARAAADVTLLITASPDAITSGGSVDLDIRVTVGSGSSGQDITDVELYLTGGSTPIATWSRIGAGRTVQDVVSDLFVPPAMLGIPFPVELHYKDFDGTAASVAGSFIVLEEAPAVPSEVRLHFTRTASVQSVTSGSTVNFIYTVRNDGVSDLIGVEISDELFGHIATIDRLAPGQKEEYIKGYRATEDVVSTPVIIYTNAVTAVSGTLALEALTVPIANPKLTVSVQVDETEIQSGDMVTINCTIINEGNVTFQDIQISEAKLGMLPGVDTLEPGKSYLCSKKDVPTNSTEYEFLVAAKDPDGNAVSIKSNKVSVTVTDEAPSVEVNSDMLTLKVTSDVTQLTSPGKVAFTISVSNKGEKSIQELTLTEINAGTIETMDTLPVGDKVFRYEADVEDQRGFVFTVTGRTSDGRRVQASSEEIVVTVQGETTPTPIWQVSGTSQAVAPPALTGSDTTPAPSGGGASGILVALVVVGILIFLCVILLVVLFVRDRRRARYARTPPPPQEYYDDYDYGDAQAPDYPPREPDYGDEDEDEVTRPVARRRQPPSQEDVRTRPSNPKRRH